MGDYEWKEVTRKNRRSVNTPMGSRQFPLPEKLHGRVTKFFMTNLPDKCSGNDLAEFLRPYGAIHDLYIARKRDKGGNRFGFASLLDVKDVQEMERKLCTIRMGEYRLKANVAKFSLEDGEIRQEPKDKEKRQTDQRKADERKGGTHQFFSGGARSFKDTLRGRQGVNQSVRTVVVKDDVNAYGGRYGKALIARMIDLEALNNIKIIMNGLCPSEGRIQYMGGLSVLISYEDKSTVTKVLNDAKELLSNEVIDRVGSEFGKVVHRAKRLDEDGDLSYDYVGVLMGDGKREAEEVLLQWRGRKFRAWVTEEKDDWVPEFFECRRDEGDETEHQKDDGQDGSGDECEEEGADADEVLQPEDEVGDGDRPKEEMTAVAGNVFNANYDVSIMGEKFKATNRGDVFTPEVSFYFEKDAGHLNNNSLIKEGNVNLNKRKKKQPSSGVGRPSPSYSISLERNKISKRPKESDLFGLNDLLEINDEEEQAGYYEEIVCNNCNNTLLLNSDGAGEKEGGVDSEFLTPAADTEGNNGKSKLFNEMEETIKMGSKLGAQLENFKELVQTTLDKERVQVVHK
ncbi:nucleotide-binding alpha-beta plait domain-containing protein [Artemisia annua]|uniref:Nucleotide-binding alpha-beta plait domain-containing protein n=1 Tax=Artemisia annua TaxID=35608 RepID=A0A2U1L7D2_ARTAN|nr:nucleotide-binding alpha-beta plait domain-containing protein [Artemisia annua]